MLIPRGKLIQDNLATSYVLLESLVDDLQEGGFSGFVEIVLRETDGYIIFETGNVAGMLEKRGEVYTGTNLVELSARSRQERGRIAIYAYSATAARIVAGRINAQTLYASLNTESTDAEKMILKLARETEREWFVEVRAESGLSALMHMSDGRCRIIRSEGNAEVEESDVAHLASNEALGNLLRECRRVGGAFDVCFAQAGDARVDLVEPAAFEASAAAASSFGPIKTQENDDLVELAEMLQIEAPPLEASAIDPPIDSTLNVETFNPPQFSLLARAEPPYEEEPRAEPQGFAVGVGDSQPAAPDQVTLTSLAHELKSLTTGDLILNVEELEVSNDVEPMSEVKRLMGEIAGAIEQASQSVGPHDNFSMCLRAGQIKIADRYPFLDPFAGEVEYLAGEIVFVGEATAEEFVAGFSEALTLALQGVMRSTAYADRFRAYVAEDLKKLLARNPQEFERFGLDRVIEQLISLQ
ncbi:MAG TPA: hypothetical protein VLM38_15215 [Blastocatellia bacterium]|nr:hypothetical protein [Blastocatellia bacterium]